MDEKTQRKKRILIGGAISLILIPAGIWFIDNTIAPLFWNSRIERIGEKDLPNATIERGHIVYCRMKADDFRFSLPSGTRATNLIITNGGFDTVYGTVEVYFDNPRQLARYANNYGFWPDRVQVGGWITCKPIPGGLLVHFQYFGDK